MSAETLGRQACLPHEIEMGMVTLTDNLMPRTTIWVITANALALVAFAGSPWGAEYPLAGVSILAFLLVQIFCPACQPCIKAPLCPANLAQCFFWIQLVLVPLLIGFYGISQATLPAFPSSQAIDTAICLRVLGYISFGVAYQCFSKPSLESSDTSERDQPDLLASDSRVPFFLIVTFAGLGLLGCFLYYRGLGGYIDYVSSPIHHQEREQEGVTLAAAAGNMLRHFLGFAMVLAWGWWMRRDHPPSGLGSCVAVTSVVGVFLLLANFTYNRGTTLAPILALAAAYSLHVRRISFKVVTLAAVVVLFVAFIFGWYRSTNLQISELSAEDIGTTWDEQHMVEFVQVYASGPQLTAHLLDHADFHGLRYYGQTLLASIVYPVPVLGKPYREASGVVILNKSIYGDLEVTDQIIAYDSELFINFHIPGVVIGYALLGWLLAIFQRCFLRAPNPVESYAWVLLGLWTVFPGSLAVTSQSYVYSFWPIYLYFLVKNMWAATLNTGTDVCVAERRMTT